MSKTSSPEPQITPNMFFSSTKSTPSRSDTPTTIFFISGNPGLISYYHDFLSLLSGNLVSEKGDSRGFRIYGASLGGFEIREQGRDDKNESDTGAKDLYDLEAQIDFVEKRLDAFMRAESEQKRPERTGRSATSMKGVSKPKVILVGHSVGSYIAMEILRRHREGRTEEEEEDAAAFDIVGAVLLFPTVVDIAESSAGKRLTWLLYFIPQLALIASLLVKLLTFALPDGALRALIRLTMRHPPESAVETTLAFLKSERGVRQALYMAADEMRTITTDKWSDDIWGMSTSKEPLSRLVFYFGRNDHWVAERTRDEIIELRGKNKSGPKMIVCEDGVPHAFCIRHNNIMACKVAQFARDIVLD